MVTSDKEIGKRIAKKRREKGISQEKLAMLTNSSQGLIAKVETGTRKIQVDLLILIADVLETDCDYLLRGIETEHLQISTATGLSESAIAKLCDYNCKTDSFGKQMNNYDKIQALEALLCIDEGQSVLNGIHQYLSCDYSQFYTDIPNENGDGFTPYNHSIGFKSHNSLVSAAYTFVGPQNFEFAAIAKITEDIKALKKALSEKQKR